MVSITKINELIPLTKTAIIKAVDGIEEEIRDFIINNNDEIKSSQKVLKGAKFNHTQLKTKLNNIVSWITTDNQITINQDFSFDVTTDKTTKEGDLIKILSDKNLAKFTRRSNTKQSKYEIKDIIKTIKQEGTVMFSEDSSSFKDNAFLRFLQYCIDNGLRNIEVFSFTRTAIETVTRSYENALDITKFIDQNFEYFDSIDVQGLNICDQLQRSIFITLVSTLEGKWLMTANTQFYPKHLLFLNVLEGNIQLDELDMNKRKEYKAMFYYNNRSIEKMTEFLNYLRVNKNKANL